MLQWLKRTHKWLPKLHVGLELASVLSEDPEVLISDNVIDLRIKKLQTGIQSLTQ